MEASQQHLAHLVAIETALGEVRGCGAKLAHTLWLVIYQLLSVSVGGSHRTDSMLTEDSRRLSRTCLNTGSEPKPSLFRSTRLQKT